MIRLLTGLSVAFLLLLPTNITRAETLDLWPTAPPDGITLNDREEELEDRTGDDQRLNRVYSYVNIPTLTVHRAAKERANGAAVVVFPGGRYRNVWIDKEGHDIARWLNTFGVTGIVVKYRTRPQPTPDDVWPSVMAATLADAKRAVRLTRHHAAEWGVDSERIGIMGFSAGGHLAVELALNVDAGQQDAEDPVERSSSRPNFAGLIYPGVPDSLSAISTESAPMFIVNAGDDPKTKPQGGVRLYSTLLEKGVPAELHVFRSGGHGFGLGLRGGSIRNWMTLFEEWMRDLNFLTRR